MIHTTTLNGLSIQTGDILCMAFDQDENSRPGDYWRILGMLIPGEVDHVAVYVGPGGRCVEAGGRGVIAFDLDGELWAAEKMFKHRGRFKDHLVGVAYPLQGLDIPEERQIRIRNSVAEYCLSQVGKPYNINFLNPDREEAFYCSQLAYKAYLPYGINLNTNRGVPNLPGSSSIVFPQEIWSGYPHKRSSRKKTNCD